MKPVIVAIDIPTDRETVYDFLSVLTAHESFTAPLLVDYEPSGPERGVSSHVRLTAVMAGRKAPVDVTVIEDVAPVRIVEQNVSAGGKRRATGTYELEPLASGGTRVSFTYAWQQVPFGDRALAPLVRAMVKRGLQQTMVRLARQFAPNVKSSDAA
jgi:hypothetical protein